MKLTLDDGIYEGDVKNGVPHGFGKLTYVGDDVTLFYEGEFVNGLRHGTGRIEFTDGEFAEGVWADDGLVYGKRQYQDGYYMGYFEASSRNGYGEEVMNNGRRWKGMWKDDKKVAHEKSQPIPNAVIVWPLGNVQLIRVEDFSCEEGLGKPLNCERVDIISTEEMREISQILEFTVVGYIDSYANQKDVVNNWFMCDLSGYERLLGPCVLCGFTNDDYAPLSCEDAEFLYDCLQHILTSDD